MDTVAEIKSRLSIVDVVSQYVQLKKAGRNFKACCPFHSEKTPSFIISPERQFAWCYGCQTGGDIFKIVQLIEGVDFKESLKILADKAGVELPTNFSGGVKKEKKDKLIEINELAADFFAQALSENSTAQEYLKGRGLKPETVKEWQVGFAPDDFDALHPQLEEKFSKKEITEAGVAGLKEMASDQLYDKFRNRIIFPIEDHRGRVVAFTGRVLDSAEPKYLNSAESPIFSKGQILFGFAKSRDAIREQKFAVVVEGQLDVISAHQAGFKNVVATSGTALTEMHLKALKNLIESVIFCFDSDSAGLESTRRALEIAAALDLNAKVATPLGGVKDPDEAFQKDPQIFADAVASAATPLDFFFDVLFAETDWKNSTEKKKAVRVLLAHAAKIFSAVEREDFIRDAATRLGSSEAALTEEFENLSASDFTPAVPEPKSKDALDSEKILRGLLLAFPKLAEKLGLAAEAESEEDEKLAVLVSDKYADFSDDEVVKEIKNLQSKVSSKSVSAKKHELKAEMQKAEAAGDDERAAELSAEYQKLLRK
ncbi:MAG: DNA primase [Candidatus Peribacteraceae bacterium]|nr:DNA primase [Candidatus Peribacteraceae bacterium]